MGLKNKTSYTWKFAKHFLRIRNSVCVSTHFQTLYLQREKQRKNTKREQEKVCLNWWCWFYWHLIKSVELSVLIRLTWTEFGFKYEISPHWDLQVWFSSNCDAPHWKAIPSIGNETAMTCGIWSPRCRVRIDARLNCKKQITVQRWRV